MGARFRSLGLALALLLTACAAPAAPTETLRPPTDTVRAVTPTRTATRTPRPTNTRLPTSTPRPTRVVTPVPTALALDDPGLAALEAQGYERSALAGFNVAASEGSLAFGGPDTAHTVPQLITGRLAYLQYQQPETQDCVLVFAHDAGQGFTVIATVAVAQLNARLSGLLTPQDDLQTTLICSPLGWGDLNDNGRPDLAVSLMWANHLTGSEVHLFEVADDLTVTDLVADLPGIVSPWAFDPAEDVLTVFDLDWAGHDCLYPPLAVAWVYGWRAGRYVDVMAERDFSGYLQSLEDAVRAGFGAPFNPYLAIGPLTQLLAVSERIGERRAGWQRYTTLSDLANFPGTDAESAAWLKSDVAHFARAMQTGAPFTPNDFCSGP